MRHMAYRGRCRTTLNLMKFGIAAGAAQEDPTLLQGRGPL